MVKICGKNGVIIADEKVAETHALTVQKRLSMEIVAIRAEKTREAKQALEDLLFSKKLGKDAVIVALGGGILTDLAAFTASTYMRGVGLVLIPTTLLGMVDAAIGGKTGVDTPFGKNLVGSFYLPKALFIEESFLKTLPEKEMKNGLSEILKYGLIADTAIWKAVAHWKEELSFLIHSSVRLTCKIVGSDFEEKMGLRRILNFGHTVGHALERISNYQMPHGEAVALGSMAECALSHFLGYLEKNALDEILAQYRTLGYAFKKMDLKNLKQLMSMDKKAKKGEARFVLIDRIGHALAFDGEYCRAAPQKEIDRMIEWMHHA
jgi:3-dehydroquinate synthase